MCRLAIPGKGQFHNVSNVNLLEPHQSNLPADHISLCVAAVAGWSGPLRARDRLLSPCSLRVPSGNSLSKLSGFH